MENFAGRRLTIADLKNLAHVVYVGVTEHEDPGARYHNDNPSTQYVARTTNMYAAENNMIHYYAQHP